MNKIRKEKGVTMLALVVTIIVLLILAAITLNLAVGENGIIERAKLARDKVKNASIAEEEAMNLAAGEIDNAGNGSSSGGSGGTGGTCPECPDTKPLENTIKELQNTIASLEQQLANEKANKAELEKQIADLNKQITDLNNQVQAQKEQIADLQGQITSKNQEIARKDETIKNLESTVTNLNNQIADLNRQIETLKAKQATGNASVSEVLAGRTFSNSNGVGLVGTMANMPGKTAAISIGGDGTYLYFRIPQGAYVTNAENIAYPEIRAGIQDINNFTGYKYTQAQYDQNYNNGHSAGYNEGYNAASTAMSGEWTTSETSWLYGWTSYGGNQSAQQGKGNKVNVTITANKITIRNASGGEQLSITITK